MTRYSLSASGHAVRNCQHLVTVLVASQLTLRGLLLHPLTPLRQPLPYPHLIHDTNHIRNLYHSALVRGLANALRRLRHGATAQIGSAHMFLLEDVVPLLIACRQALDELVFEVVVLRKCGG